MERIQSSTTTMPTGPSFMMRPGGPGRWIPPVPRAAKLKPAARRRAITGLGGPPPGVACSALLPTTRLAKFKLGDQAGAQTDFQRATIAVERSLATGIPPVGGRDGSLWQLGGPILCSDGQPLKPVARRRAIAELGAGGAEQPLPA